MNEERDVIAEVIAEDNARPTHPAVAEYAVRALHTATSDGERVAELELLNAELWRQNAQRDARIEEQAREIERLKADLDDCDGGRWKLRTELAALKAQPRGVVLPKRLGECRDELADARASGWNDAIDKVVRLNSSPVSAVVIYERAAFDAYFCKRHSYKPGTDTTMINSAFEPWHAWQARAALNAGSAVPDGEQVPNAVELLSKLRAMINCTPENDLDQCGVWISTRHPVIELIDAMLAASGPRLGENVRELADNAISIGLLKPFGKSILEALDNVQAGYALMVIPHDPADGKGYSMRIVEAAAPTAKKEG